MNAHDLICASDPICFLKNNLSQMYFCFTVNISLLCRNFGKQSIKIPPHDAAGPPLGESGLLNLCDK
jgi:hypothetical protein